MICLTVGLGGSAGPTSAPGVLEGPPFFFLSVVKMSKSSSGKAGFFPEGFDDAFGALVDDDAVAAAGALLLAPPFPFFAILTSEYLESRPRMPMTVTTSCLGAR